MNDKVLAKKGSSNSILIVFTLMVGLLFFVAQSYNNRLFLTVKDVLERHANKEKKEEGSPEGWDTFLKKNYLDFFAILFSIIVSLISISVLVRELYSLFFPGYQEKKKIKESEDRVLKENKARFADILISMCFGKKQSRNDPNCYFYRKLKERAAFYERIHMKEYKNRFTGHFAVPIINSFDKTDSIGLFTGNEKEHAEVIQEREILFRTIVENLCELFCILLDIKNEKVNFFHLLEPDFLNSMLSGGENKYFDDRIKKTLKQFIDIIAHFVFGGFQYIEKKAVCGTSTIVKVKYVDYETLKENIKKYVQDGNCTSISSGNYCITGSKIQNNENNDIDIDNFKTFDGKIEDEMPDRIINEEDLDGKNDYEIIKKRVPVDMDISSIQSPQTRVIQTKNGFNNYKHNINNINNIDNIDNINNIDNTFKEIKIIQKRGKK